jgi:hypothetical protein
MGEAVFAGFIFLSLNFSVGKPSTPHRVAFASGPALKSHGTIPAAAVPAATHIIQSRLPNTHGCFDNLAGGKSIPKTLRDTAKEAQ